MTAIANAYINALLADAAYVDLVDEPLSSSTNRRVLGDRMTPTLAAYIAANFEVASSINSSDIPLFGSGFDATVWRGKAGGDFEGQVYVSMRGTEPPPVAAGADLLADGDLAFRRAATSPIIDMVNWWLRETTPTNGLARQLQWNPLYVLNNPPIVTIPSFIDGTSVAGTGRLVGVSNVQVDGHSMGGHMASAFARIFGAANGQPGSVNIQGISTFNSAGFNGDNAESLFQEIQALLGTGFSSFTEVIARQGNYFAANGVNVTTNDWWFAQMGNRNALYQEETSGMGNHSMYRLTDLLAVGAALEKLDSTFTIDKLNELSKVGSSDPKASLEGVLDSLRLALGGPNVERLPISDAADSDPSRMTFHTKLADLQASAEYKVLIGRASLRILANTDRDTLVAGAKNDFGTFLALKYLLPVALEGSPGVLGTVHSGLYAEDEADKLLTAADGAAGEKNFSDLYLADRAAFLAWKLQLATADFKESDGAYTKAGVDAFFSDMGSKLQINLGSNWTIPSDKQRYIFGTDQTDGSSEVLTGGSRADNLYGGGGNDVLYGYDQNDYLEGNAGSDTLNGGLGNDLLFGGLGDDTLTGGADKDTYRFAPNSGTDHVIDDGNDSIEWKGLPIAGVYRWQEDRKAYLRQGDGSAITLSLDGQSTLTFEDGSKIILDRQNGIDGFKDDPYGIRLEKLPTQPPTTVEVPGDIVPTVFNITVTATMGQGNGWSAEQSSGLSARELAQAGMGTAAYDGAGLVGSILPANTLSYSIVSVDKDANSMTVAYRLFDALGNIVGEHKEMPEGFTYTDELWGSNGNDHILALRGNDWVQAGKGDDIVVGGTQDAFPGYQDYLMGEQGNDLLYADEEVSLAALPSLSKFGGAVANDRIGDNLFGGIGNDILVGSARRDLILGGAGKDLILGGAGDDELNGDQDRKPGDVSFFFDRASGEFGSRYVVHERDRESTGFTTIGEGAQQFTVWGSWYPRYLDAAPGGDADTIYGGAGNDRIYGMLGGDILYGEDGDDVMTGDEGKDYLYGGNDDDQIDGGDEADFIDGGTGKDTLYGGDGEDIIIGGKGDDILYGGVGKDTYIYNKGDGTDIIWDTPAGIKDPEASVLVLGGGIKKADVKFRLGSLHVDVGNGEGLHFEGFGPDTPDATPVIGEIRFDDGRVMTYADILEQGFDLDGTAGDDTITGTAVTDRIDGKGGNDTLIAGAGDDVLTGGTGDDLLDGGAGMDRMQGGVGNDTYVVDDAGDVIVENAGEGIDAVLAGVDHALADNFENLRLTGSGNLTGTGNNVDNVISGNDGDNALDGMDGNDTLNGGAGNDLMRGGAGDDIYYVDSEGDTTDETDGSGFDQVFASVGTTLGNGLENLTLTGSANISGMGNELDNILTGNVGNNWLDGGAGADRMAGGVGDDTYVVDNVGDVIVENAGEGIDRVLAGIDYTLADNFENLTLTGSGNLTGAGNEVDNVITGNDGDNVLSGLGGNDTLNGGAGGDLMQGGAGDDTYYVDSEGDRTDETVGDGFDRVFASAGTTLGNGLENLTLTGSADISGAGNGLDNVITGNDGDNLLQGLAGNDTLNGGRGQDTLEGGQGNDTYIVDSSNDVVLERFGEGYDLVRASNSFALSDNIEELRLTGDFADYGHVDGYSGTGNALANVMTGNDGGNVLDGLMGNDSIDGRAGDDRIFGGDGNDTLYGGDDAIYQAGGGGSESLRAMMMIAPGGGGSSGPVLASNADYIDGGMGNDVIDGGSGDDTLYGGDGNDVIYGGDDGLTTGSGGVGGPALFFGRMIAVVPGGGGETGSQQLSNNDYLDGGAGNDILDGGSGNDTLIGGQGSDTMTGGLGNDTYAVDNTRDKVIELAGEGVDTVTSSISLTLVANVENLILAGSANISGTGNSLDNALAGNAGRNTLNGGLGADSMAGAAGNDTYYVDNAGDIVTELASEGTDRIISTIGYTLGVNVENLTLSGSDALNGTGNALDNAIVGNAAANVLSGLGGNDRLTGGVSDDALDGGEGNDTLNGGLGADAMTGGAGNDSYYVDAAGDVVTELADEGTDRVISTISYTLGDNVENLTLSGSDAIDGTGNALDNIIVGNVAANALSGLGGNDRLTGGASDDALDGGEGNDTLNGGLGADAMTGGVGNDTFYVDDAGDAVTELAGEGTDRVISTISTTLGDNIENLTLSGSGAIDGSGNALANSLTGNAATNLLNGADGNDRINGAAGLDFLEGMGGNDTLTDTVGSSYFNGGSGADRLTGGAGADFFLGGAGNDILVTGAGDDVIAFNKGDGYDTITVGAGSKTVSLGGALAYSDLQLRKSGNDLVLDSGSGEGMTFKNWYVGTTNQNVLSLQVMAEAMGGFDAGGSDPLLDSKVENFDFKGLAGAFDTARTVNPGLSSWALTNALAEFHLAGSDSAALGGDLAYQYGKNCTLAGIGITPAFDVLNSAAFGASAQTLTPLAGLQTGTQRLS